MHDGGPEEYHEALCRRFVEALRELSRDNLLFAPIPDRREGRAVRSLAGFVEHHVTAGSPAEMLDLTRARCVFTSGESGIEERFDAARREILAGAAARAALIAKLRETPGSGGSSGPLAIDDARGGLRDVERAARLLQLTHAGADPDFPSSPAATSVFRAAGARGWTPEDPAERLADAAKRWRNLRGIVGLVAEDGFAVEEAPPMVQAVIARACGMEDFEALTAMVSEMAARAAADIDSLDGMHRASIRNDGGPEPSHPP